MPESGPTENIYEQTMNLGGDYFNEYNNWIANIKLTIIETIGIPGRYREGADIFFARVGDDKLMAAIRRIREDGKKVRTVEERFLSPDSDQRIREFFGDSPNPAYHRYFKEITIDHPKKVDRMNKVAYILNTSEDIAEIKRALNEGFRLTVGGENFFSDEESNPDLLNI